MQEIRKILETLINTPSLNERVALLQTHQNNLQLFLLLQTHLNPYRQFYIAKMPLKRPSIESVSLGGGEPFDKFMHLCGLLTNRTLSGHAALATVYDFFQTLNEDERWVFKTVLMKEPLGFGASVVNRVKPKWVPEFDLMLADAKQPKIEAIKYPVIAQHKLDGFRAVYFSSTKVFLGRNGRPLRNENLLSYFKELSQLGDKYIIDGELYSDTLSFNEIASVLNSEDKELTSIYYCVYDIIPVKDWEKRQCNTSYEDRYNLLANLCKTSNFAQIRPVKGIKATCAEEVQRFYDTALVEGLEGLMLKDPQGFYQWKRVTLKSGIMMKLKPQETLDGKIVGFEEGTGKLQGSLGALVVNVENIKNTVKIGTGYSEEIRQELWNSRNSLIGKWVVLKCFEITENNESLRFPVFVSIRDAKD